MNTRSLRRWVRVLLCLIVCNACRHEGYINIYKKRCQPHLWTFSRILQAAVFSASVNFFPHLIRKLIFQHLWTFSTVFLLMRAFSSQKYTPSGRACTVTRVNSGRSVHSRPDRSLVLFFMSPPVNEVPAFHPLSRSRGQWLLPCAAVHPGWSQGY